MAINDFKNIENINLNLASTAQLLDSKDLTIFKTGAKNITDFGMSENDVIEFRVYDLGNNLLEQTDYGNVRYIAKQDLPKYLISEPDQQTGESILTIDVETLLNEGGFGNGEFNVIINFLKNYVGTNNTKQRVWIHEVSPSRNEIRIVPLAGDDKVQHRYNAFMDDGVEFKDNVNVIVNAIDAAQTMISDSIDNCLKQQYGEGWLKSVRNDFKLGTDPQYTALKNDIYTTFKKNVLTDISKLNQNEFYGNTELSNIITNNIQLAVELLTKDLVYVEYPQVVKQALQQNQDKKADQQYDEAKKIYRKLIIKDPQYADAYFNLGTIYYNEDSIDIALRMFNYAIQMQPTYAEAYYGRGLVEELQNKNDAAIADFQQALNLDADFEKAQKELDKLTAAK